jgi:hypothetical protein
MESEYNSLSNTMRDLLPFKELVLVIGKIVRFTDEEVTTMKKTVWEENVVAIIC